MTKPGEMKRDGEGWIGFDFDGTLAYHEPGTPLDSVGRPIPKMLELLKKALALGWKVRIFTARAYCKTCEIGAVDCPSCERQHNMIDGWCIEHIDRVLPITCVKDGAMVLLFDDRAVTVARNQGLMLSLCDDHI